MSGLFIYSSALTAFSCSMVLSVASSAILVLEIFFVITLQDTIDTVTIEGVENVQDAVRIEIKTEENYIKLVQTVKTEEKVSVLCCSVCMYGVLYCNVLIAFRCALVSYVHITSFYFLRINWQDVPS